MASQSTQSSPTNSALKELNISDLSLLCNTLNPVASKCFALGLQLGVEYSQLHSTEYNYRNCEDQLREIIAERLKQNSPLTWHAIVTALQSPSVNYHDLARHIESQYISPSPKAQQHLLSDPQHDNAESPHMMYTYTSAHRSIQAPAQYYSNPTTQTHTPLIPPPSAINMGGTYPLHQQRSKQCPFQSPQPLNAGIYSPFPSHTSFLSCHHYQSPLHHSQIQPHIPTQYTSPYPLSTNPFPQLPQSLHPQPLHVPSSIHQSVSSYDQFTSRSTGHTSPHNYTPFIDVVNQHSDVLTDTISGDLTFFINKFIELGFVTRTATANILSQHGVGNGEKAGKLLNLITTYFNRVHNKKKWFDEFVGVFSSEAAYEDLANGMTVSLEKMRWSDFGSSEPLPQLEKSAYFRSPMDAFVHYIKVRYKQCEIERNLNVLKWPPTPSKVFINLACIDWESVVGKKEADEYTRAMVEDGNVDVIMKKKKNIDFSDIAMVEDSNVDVIMKKSDFSDKSVPPKRVVLVEGAPGVGKSTFAWEFCRRWERGEIAQQYQLVLLLRLRDERMSRAKSLRDLIYHPSEDTCHLFAVELVDCLGMNTLIILEGFDELPDFQRRESSIFLQLILGDMLPLATILVTSRPWATGALLVKFKHRIFQHIEILGFTEENITKYVTSVFTGEGKKTASATYQSGEGPSQEAKKNVMAYLHTYPQIKACMYIPLNAAIVVNIHQESKKKNCILPKTLTELYYALAQVLILRYLYGHADYSKRRWNIDSFEKDLPDKVYKQLLTICKVAYDGICTKDRIRVQLIFSDDDLGDCETLGLMQCVSQLFMGGQKTSHNFLHLTFQEFLAAFLISTMSQAEQLKHFQRHQDGRLKVVLRFLAGITKLKKVTPAQLKGILGEPIIKPKLTPYYTPIRPDICVSAHHTNWLFEAQNSELLQSLFHNHTISFTFVREMLPLEYYSVGYCIANSHSKWALTFDGHTDKKKLNMLVSGATDGDCRVASVKTTSMTPENLQVLVNCFSSSVEELYYLKIPENTTSLFLPPLSTLRILELQIESAFNISCDLSFSSLESLIINSSRKGTTLSTKTCEAIGKLLSSTTSLKEFCLSEFSTHVSDNDVGVITKGLSYNLAPPLKSLDIDCRCTFTTTATRSLVQFITRSTTLQYLKIHINTFESVDIFAKGLSNNIALPLKSLCIDCKCIFTTTATRSLAQFITRSTILQYIRIYHVTFSAQGLIELTEAMRHCSRLQEKKLEQLLFRLESSEDVVNLRYMIKDHPDVQKSITDWDGVTNVLSFSIKTHHQRKPSILNLGLGCNEDKSLKLVNMSISDSVTIALAQALYHNSTLEVLDLSYNNVSDAGVVALAQTFHSSTLNELYLCNNSISDDGAVALAQALHHNYTLQVLDLSGNDTIGKEGTHQLVRALTVNTSITKVTMYYWGGGLILPRRCEEYASQCTQYNTVKDRIRFF